MKIRKCIRLILYAYLVTHSLFAGEAALETEHRLKELSDYFHQCLRDTNVVKIVLNYLHDTSNTHFFIVPSYIFPRNCLFAKTLILKMTSDDKLQIIAMNQTSEDDPCSLDEQLGMLELQDSTIDTNYQKKLLQLAEHRYGQNKFAIELHKRSNETLFFEYLANILDCNATIVSLDSLEYTMNLVFFPYKIALDHTLTFQKLHDYLHKMYQGYSYLADSGFEEYQEAVYTSPRIFALAYKPSDIPALLKAIKHGETLMLQSK